MDGDREGPGRSGLCRSRSQKAQRAPCSRTKGPRYTPVSKRQDKPDGIAWILRHHPEISDAQIGKPDRHHPQHHRRDPRSFSHWNIANIQPKDPVTLGLCSQRELDAIVAKAAKKAGLEAPVDARLDGAREALIEELRRERDEAHRHDDAHDEAGTAPSFPTGEFDARAEAEKLFDR
jgi:hypothetical protein